MVYLLDFISSRFGSFDYHRYRQAMADVEAFLDATTPPSQRKQVYR